MNNIINLQTARRNRRQTKASGITLCQSGVSSNRPLHFP
jgi:hypothetical protein